MSVSLSGIDLYEVFNAKLGEFLEDLRGVIGGLPDYKVLLSSVKFLAQFQPRQNHKLFHQYVETPYGARILERDEAFFAGHEFSEASSVQNAGDIVGLLKGQWRTLADADKAAIWAHLHILMAVSRKIV